MSSSGLTEHYQAAALQSEVTCSVVVFFLFFSFVFFFYFRADSLSKVSRESVAASFTTCDSSRPRGLLLHLVTTNAWTLMADKRVCGFVKPKARGKWPWAETRQRSLTHFTDIPLFFCSVFVLPMKKSFCLCMFNLFCCWSYVAQLQQLSRYYFVSQLPGF